MTSEEAIKIIERIQEPEPRELPYLKVFEALGMAIDALQTIDQYKCEHEMEDAE